MAVVGLGGGFVSPASGRPSYTTRRSSIDSGQSKPSRLFHAWLRLFEVPGFVAFIDTTDDGRPVTKQRSWQSCPGALSELTTMSWRSCQ
jgi:hypothetical protein